ncbi:MAG TPA: hypothetical protein VFW13_09725, partial [Phenylobacterium sp.]|nr:hypothetical protein [Phenylobacterium sp.]
MPLPASAQGPTADKIVVPLGVTGMVDNPCPPQPPVPIARFGEPGRPAVYAAPEVLAAYQR